MANTSDVMECNNSIHSSFNFLGSNLLITSTVKPVLELEILLSYPQSNRLTYGKIQQEETKSKDLLLSMAVELMHLLSVTYP